LSIDKHQISITLSMGVASMPGNDGLALDILLNHADEALYVAKEKGRSRVSAWEETK
jgi:diguanylate cyclase (GGDEF)-like protein